MDGGLRLPLILGAPSEKSFVDTLILLDGDEPPRSDASSRRMAFASALKPIGGTGTSSSELSSLSSATDTDISGGPRFSIGLDGWSRRLSRESGHDGKVSRLVGKGVGEAAAMVKEICRGIHTETTMRLSDRSRVLSVKQRHSLY